MERSVDAWESQGTILGATRYNETGRNGYVAYPNDCARYESQGIGYYWWAPSPMWVCGWYHVYETDFSVDYVCVQAH